MRPHSIVIALAVSGALFGQSAAPLEFEVASIKLNKSVRNGIGNRYEPQRMTWTNAPLSVLIQSAFHVEPYALMGAPSWTDEEKWDIAATTSAPASNNQKRDMLQTLLIRRFHLQFHREMRTLPILELVAEKNVSKLTEHHVPSERAGITPGPGKLIGRRIPMSTMAEFLSLTLGKPVNDKTGLTGEYDFDLIWSADDLNQNGAGQDASIFTAVQEIGLRLKASKGPVEVFVVDNVERPSEN
jgi:uncharacterized protein (TIGR03435 family)